MYQELHSDTSQANVMQGSAAGIFVRGLVSVIIPVFNREKLVGAALDSVLSQIYTNYEILCIDDGSTDGSVDVLNKYAESHPSVITVIKNYRAKGVSGARNCGLDAAKGEYIAFLDSDDKYKPVHLSESIESLVQNPEIDLVFSDIERIKDGVVVEKSVYQSNSKDMRRLLGKDLVGCRVYGHHSIRLFIKHDTLPWLHTSVVRTKFCANIRFDECLAIFEDYKFRFDLIKSGARMAFINSIHHEYYFHTNNTYSGNSSEKTVINCDQRILFIKRLEAAHHLTVGEKIILRKRAAGYLFWQCGCRLLDDNLKTEARRFMKVAITIAPPSLSLLKSFVIKYIKMKVG
jgi:glycosyltransferase involved in cell wall biosynthesis